MLGERTPEHARFQNVGLLPPLIAEYRSHIDRSHCEKTGLPASKQETLAARNRKTRS